MRHKIEGFFYLLTFLYKRLDKYKILCYDNNKSNLLEYPFIYCSTFKKIIVMKKIALFVCLVAGCMFLSSCGTDLLVATPVPPVGTVVVATPTYPPVVVYGTYPYGYYSRGYYHRPAPRRHTPPPPPPRHRDTRRR